MSILSATHHHTVVKHIILDKAMKACIVFNAIAGTGVITVLNVLKNKKRRS